jgi:predicted enzyme related to lactoylglutathione lyase
MPEARYYRPGMFCLVDLTTEDQAKARAYYLDVFGWTAQDMDVPGGSYFSLMRKRNLMAAAIAPRPPMLAAGSSWNSYVCVEDAAEVAARAKELGATILADASEVGPAGKVAIIQSPTGEHFMVWQPGTRAGAEIVNEPGGFVWTELYTRDAEKSADFYMKLFGWTKEVQKMGGMPAYTRFAVEGRNMCGMIEIDDEMQGTGPMWAVYFAVGDLDAATKAAKRGGGQVIVDEIKTPDVGRFAMFLDPVGAQYFAIQLAHEPEPLPAKP